MDAPGIGLVVDDESILAGSIARLVRRHVDGMEVEMSTDSIEAIERAGEQRIALLVTDLKMPSRSGVDVIDAVRARWSDASIVLATAFLPSELKGLSFHTLVLLPKPFRSSALALALRDAMTRARADGAREKALDALMLRMLELSTGVLHVCCDGARVARVDLFHGQIVHAEDEHGVGEAVLHRLRDGACRVDAHVFEASKPSMQTVALQAGELVRVLGAPARVEEEERGNLSSSARALMNVMGVLGVRIEDGGGELVFELGAPFDPSDEPLVDALLLRAPGVERDSDVCLCAVCTGGGRLLVCVRHEFARLASVEMRGIARNLVIE